MRKKLIAGNWKMNKTTTEAIELTNGLKRELYKIDNVDIVLCPPFTALDEVLDVIYESNLKLGAQNMHGEDSGAFTGEISAPMIKELGCTFVILGHSSEGNTFFETNDTVNKKLKKALKAGLTPIVCVGENLAERESNKTFKIIEDHVTNGLKDLTQEEAKKIVIAYEPVWAIGTGKTATPAQAQEVHQFIRSLLAKMFSSGVAEEIQILYGGSVKPENTKDLISQKDIDGALVGGASLDVKSFSDIVKNSAEVL